jgi:hypothetical protein
MHRSPRFLGSCVVIGVFIYLADILALHMLRPDFDPMRRFLSEYAVGRFGILGTVSFCVMAATVLTFRSGLHLGVQRSLPLNSTSLFLALAAAGFLTSALFPTDVQPTGGGRPIPTRAGAIHDMSALLLFTSLILAALILPSALKRDPSWRSFSLTARLLGILILVLFVAFIVAPWRLKGLVQRAEVAAILTWLLMTGLRLRKLALGAGRATAA